MKIVIEILMGKEGERLDKRVKETIVILIIMTYVLYAYYFLLFSVSSLNQYFIVSIWDYV